MTDSRKEFEAWWQKTTASQSAPERFKDGYTHRNPGLAWVAWQASRAATPEPEASKRQIREDFEKWYGSKPSRFVTGNYEDIVVQARWEAYRAGRESVMNKPAQADEEFIIKLLANRICLKGDPKIRFQEAKEVFERLRPYLRDTKPVSRPDE